MKKGNWPTVKLSDFVVIQRGLSYSSKDLGESGNGVPLYNLKSVKRDGRTSTTDFKYFKGVVKDRNKIARGDLLIALTDLTPTAEIIGLPLIVESDIDACYSADLGKVIIKGAIIPKYLFYCLRSRAYRQIIKSFSHGTNVKHLNTDGIYSYKIPLPPVESQLDVVSTLDALVELRKKREEADRKMAAFTPALFYKMFGDPGKNEKGWEVKRLEEVAERITKGTTPTTAGFSFQDQGVNFIKIESITETGEILKERVAHVSDECHRSFQRSQLKPNDVLFSIAGALGRATIVTEDLLPANTNQALSIITLKKEVTPEFVFYFLRSDYILERIKSLKVGVAQFNLSLKQIGDLMIPVPPMEIQKQFSERVAMMRAINQKQSETRKELDKVFEGVMSQIL